MFVLQKSIFKNVKKNNDHCYANKEKSYANTNCPFLISFFLRKIINFNCNLNDSGSKLKRYTTQYLTSNQSPLPEWGVFSILDMTNTIIEYNDDSASHYKSYRPPLHETLLSQMLKDRKFKNVLDVGCGTGNSSIALTKYGESVTGYDPSGSMLQQSQKHPKVNYTKKLNLLFLSLLEEWRIKEKTQSQFSKKVFCLQKKIKILKFFGLAPEKLIIILRPNK